ncbi:hypothetical protein HZC32_03040 [Candidatus Woesearchaeota archaeon]|nr:hypothetical protein [Candidatus Woesearchaeota archaeon]
MDDESMFSLINLIESSDLILLDTSFLGVDGDFSKDIYNIKSLLDLEEFRGRIEKVNQYWLWLLRKVISQPNVYTTPKVIEEVKLLREHIHKIHQFHQFGEKILQTERYKTNTHKKSTKKNNRCRDYWKSLMLKEKREEIPSPQRIKAEKTNLYYRSRELDLLNTLWCYINKSIEQLQLYTGKSFSFYYDKNAAQAHNPDLKVGVSCGSANAAFLACQKLRPEGRGFKPHTKTSGEVFVHKEIAETDYQVAGAGIGYLLDNPGKEIGIFTEDNHFREILLDYLASNHSLSTPGAITVYCFKQEPENPEQPMLKEKISSRDYRDYNKEELRMLNNCMNI